jgi:phage tail sheath protein FI
MSLFSPRTPGVYLRSVEPAPVAELATGVPALLGQAGLPPLVNQPTALRQWPAFAAAFPDAPADGPLAAAVRGFFENGGELCYVVPLAQGGAPDDTLAAGLAALATNSDVDLIAMPDLVAARTPAGAPVALDDLVRLQQRLIDDCDRHGARLALLDAAADADVATVLRQRARLSGTNAALYYPWLVVRDGSGIARAVPPCGHVALEGVLDLARAVSADDQGELNPQGINAMRVFPGRGIRVWGARTVSQDRNWRYVNVRRLFMTAGRWIERNLTPLAFEPHDTRLWARIGRELTAYFNGLYQKGALKGASAAEAFVIKCDAENNPPESRAAGAVVTDVAFAAAVPNEFVVVRISVAPSGVTLAALG